MPKQMRRIIHALAAATSEESEYGTFKSLTYLGTDSHRAIVDHVTDPDKGIIY